MKQYVNNPYDNYSCATEKHMQVIFLYEIEKLCCEKISEIVNYACSTVKKYIREYSYLLDKAKDFFKEKIIKPLTRPKRVDWNNLEVKEQHCFYVVSFYDEDKNYLFNKIGTSKNIKRRMTEELKEYEKLKVYQSKLHFIYYCKDEKTSLALESYFRYCFIMRNNENDYIKNDRFIFPFDLDFIKKELENFNLTLDKPQEV